MSGVRGICPQCGASYYYSQAVSGPRDQACSDCGHVLEIFKDGVRLQKDSSSSATWTPNRAKRRRKDQ